MKHLFFALLTLFSAFFVGCGEHTFDTLGLSGDCKGIKCEDSSSSVNKQSSSSVNMQSSSSINEQSSSSVNMQSSSSGYANNNNCSMNKANGSPYRTVTIGTQTWMAENMDCSFGYNICYARNQSNCTKYGRLYNWETAMTICPQGWHLPAREEWNVLVNYVQSAKNCSNCAGKYLKSSSGWNNNSNGGNGNGLDSYNFKALPGGLGYNDDNYLWNVGDIGGWWTSSGLSSLAYLWAMGKDSDVFNESYDSNTSFFSSVRCVKN